MATTVRHENEMGCLLLPSHGDANHDPHAVIPTMMTSKRPLNVPSSARMSLLFGELDGGRVSRLTTPSSATAEAGALAARVQAAEQPA